MEGGRWPGRWSHGGEWGTIVQGVPGGELGSPTFIAGHTAKNPSTRSERGVEEAYGVGPQHVRTVFRVGVEAGWGDGWRLGFLPNRPKGTMRAEVPSFLVKRGL